MRKFILQGPSVSPSDLHVQNLGTRLLANGLQSKQGIISPRRILENFAVSEEIKLCRKSKQIVDTLHTDRIFGNMDVENKASCRNVYTVEPFMKCNFYLILEYPDAPEYTDVIVFDWQDGSHSLKQRDYLIAQHTTLLFIKISAVRHD